MNSLERRVVHALSDLHDSYHVTGIKAESDPRASGWMRRCAARRRSRLPFVPSCRPHAPSSSGAAASRISRRAALWVVVPRPRTARRPGRPRCAGRSRGAAAARKDRLACSCPLALETRIQPALPSTSSARSTCPERQMPRARFSRPYCAKRSPPLRSSRTSCSWRRCPAPCRRCERWYWSRRLRIRLQRPPVGPAARSTPSRISLWLVGSCWSSTLARSKNAAPTSPRMTWPQSSTRPVLRGHPRVSR